MRATLVLLLGLFATNLHAAVLAFDDTTYTTSAQVEAGVNSDSRSATSPPLPIFSSAFTSDGGGNHSSASGQAGDGVLAVTAVAASDTLATSGFGVSNFRGTFLSTSTGQFGLHIHFDTDDQIAGAGGVTSEGMLHVTLFGNGDSLYDQSFLAGTDIDQTFNLAAGTFASLEITLTSTTTALNAFSLNASSAQFATAFAPVPEPGTWMLVITGLLMLGFMRVRQSQ